MLLLGVFWLARRIFDHDEREGILLVIRWVAWIGTAACVIAVVQSAASPKLLYGVWKPDDASARPFGPFVNRNHMATWLLLAIPLTWGQVMAHLRTRMHGLPGRHLAVVRAVDSTIIWQVGAGLTMLSTLFVSVSRSGVIGLVAATITGFALTRARLGRLRVKWIAGATIFALITATYFANFDALATRFSQALDQPNERAEIWRQTMPIVRDFLWTGTGDGTFGRAMLVYQHGDRQLLFNQAHNHYVQILAEGGLLMGLPALCAIIMLVVLTVRRLKSDATALFWVRAGAAAGLVAVATQSLWETGLRMPANGVLFAVCAALAVHVRRTPVGQREDGSGGRRSERHRNRLASLERESATGGGGRRGVSAHDRAKEELPGGRMSKKRPNQIAVLIEPDRRPHDGHDAVGEREIEKSVDVVVGQSRHRPA
jgi:O-antigen ligase